MPENSYIFNTDTLISANYTPLPSNNEHYAMIVTDDGLQYCLESAYYTAAERDGNRNPQQASIFIENDTPITVYVNAPSASVVQWSVIAYDTLLPLNQKFERVEYTDPLSGLIFNFKSTAAIMPKEASGKGWIMNIHIDEHVWYYAPWKYNLQFVEQINRHSIISAPI